MIDNTSSNLNPSIDVGTSKGIYNPYWPNNVPPHIISISIERENSVRIMDCGHIAVEIV